MSRVDVADRLEEVTIDSGRCILYCFPVDS
jgi:hypothetical protein